VKKGVIICSGGLDSTVLYYKLKADGWDLTALNFSYGSKHNNAERTRAITLIPELKFIDLDFSFLTKSSLLNQEVPVPHGHYAAENMKSTVVPFRNGIMLSYAVAVAEELQAEAVFLGSHAGDHAIYPDCRPEFTAAFSQAASAGTFLKIPVEAPFAMLTKTNIAEIGKALGIEDVMAATWSCYEGQDIHCGKCGSCVERREAFRDARVLDKTGYKE